MTTTVGPCDWPISYAGCSSGAERARDNLDATDLNAVETMATEFLWRWTGKVFGTCPVVYRPCRVTTNARSQWSPLASRAGLRYGGCGVCGSLCNCSGGTRSLKLPGPVTEVQNVTVSGQPLPLDAWRLEEDLLIRQDGQAWPLTQNLELPPGTPGTWEVNYVQGVPVPVGGQVAAGVLAGELARALCNDAGCLLPKRLQSITREGVTVAMLDNFEGMDDGKTGLWLVDSWVYSITKPPVMGQVYSPDLPRKRHYRQSF